MRGVRLPAAPGVRRIADVQNIVQTKTKKPIMGPRTRWHQPAFSLELAKALEVANYDQISSGIGAANVRELIQIRNYIVHPNQTTKEYFNQIARDLGVTTMVTDDLLTSTRAGGATLFETWLRDL